MFWHSRPLFTLEGLSFWMSENHVDFRNSKAGFHSTRDSAEQESCHCPICAGVGEGSAGKSGAREEACALSYKLPCIDRLFRAFFS